MNELSQLLDLQKLVFDNEPKRLSLLRYSPKATLTKHIQVFRNHSFELVEKILPAYFDLLDFKVEFSYSDYDDSFAFSAIDKSADAIILWIDAARYKRDPLDFIKGRVAALRKQYDGFIFVVALGVKLGITLDGVFIMDVGPIYKALGEGMWDVASEPFTGTRMSKSACMSMARALGLCYIPALLMPPMKAVVVDFDNTLYSGVLGEDGGDALALSQGHIRVQNRLVQMSESGVFVCGVTKNDPKDIELLFEKRPDFPLKRSHFTCLSASWNAKSSSIKEICSSLNIGADSVLFVDDNIGELSEVLMAVPGIKVALAEPSGEQTASLLEGYPGFFRFSKRHEDVVRGKDVVANKERLAMQHTMTREEYLRELQMEVTVSFNEHQTIERISELSRKTNQFIFSYKRYTPREISLLMDSGNSVVIALSLKDKLSDSGIICGIVLRANEDFATLEECFVSCRALGRGIEHEFIFCAIEKGMERLGKSKLLVNFTRGERNEPAQRFVEGWLSMYLLKPERFVLAVQQPCLKINYGGIE